MSVIIETSKCITLKSEIMKILFKGNMLMLFRLAIQYYVIVLSLADNGRSKPCPRKKSRNQYLSEPEENLCLLRASNGKKKISTVVRA